MSEWFHFISFSGKIIKIKESLAGENDEKGNINGDVEIYTELNKALQSDDWNAAKEFLNTHPHAISAKITDTKKTALHVAAEAGHEHIVEELVNIMSEENLEIKDFEGVNVYYVMGFRPNYFTCTAHLYLYCILLVPHTYASYIRH